MFSLIYYQYTLYLIYFVTCNLFNSHLLLLLLYTFHVLSFSLTSLILLLLRNLITFYTYTCTDKYVLPPHLHMDFI